jgi:hypothetical protein
MATATAIECALSRSSSRDACASTQARNPYARWWLWIPGSCCARPGMTMRGIARLSLLEVRAASRRAYGDGDRMCTLSIVIPGCVRKHAGLESKRPMVVMDSGLVLRTPRNDGVGDSSTVVAGGVGRIAPSVRGRRSNVHSLDRRDACASMQARNPCARLWLWIPGSCCARPGMTAWGITRLSLLEVRAASRRAYGDRMCTLDRHSGMRAQARRPGIHTPDGGYGFRARASHAPE